MVYDAQILDAESLVPQMELLGVLSRAEAIAVRQQALIDSGAAVPNVEINILAIANALQWRTPSDRLGACVVLDIGWNGCTLGTFDAVSLKLVRSHDVGLSTLVEQVGMDGHLLPQDFLRTVHAGADVAQVAPERYQEWIENLRDFVKQSLGRLREGEPRPPVYLTGDGAILSGLAPLASDALGLDVQVFDPLELGAPGAAFALPKLGTGPAFAGCVGVALRQLSDEIRGGA
jgi:Tfp pilus assembly PilM family ATPase